MSPSNFTLAGEAEIVQDKYALVLLNGVKEDPCLDASKGWKFCGAVLQSEELESSEEVLEGKEVFLYTGSSADVCSLDDVSSKELAAAVQKADCVRIVCRGGHLEDYSRIATEKFGKSVTIVDEGALPILVHGVGVLFRNFFPNERTETSYFNQIVKAHHFQALTESNKGGNANRLGLYLSRVRESEDRRARIFNLLRCSTNLNGAH